MISPTMVVSKTMISQSTPLIPRDSASLYTQMQIKIPTMNQTTGIRHMPPTASISHCSTGKGIIFLTWRTISSKFLIKFISMLGR